MKQQIPYEKMSKKQRREEDAKRRGTWREVNPVTRRVESARVYQRAKLKRQRNDPLPYFFTRFQLKNAGI